MAYRRRNTILPSMACDPSNRWNDYSFMDAQCLRCFLSSLTDPANCEYRKPKSSVFRNLALLVCRVLPCPSWMQKWFWFIRTIFDDYCCTVVILAYRKLAKLRRNSFNILRMILAIGIESEQNLLVTVEVNLLPICECAMATILTAKKHRKHLMAKSNRSHAKNIEIQ